MRMSDSANKKSPAIFDENHRPFSREYAPITLRLARKRFILEFAMHYLINAGRQVDVWDQLGRHNLEP